MDSVAEYDVELSGEATTYMYTPYTSEKGDQDSTYGFSALFDTLYRSGYNTLDNINLGIKKIYDPDYDIVENLAYVKIVCNDQEYMYKYNIDYELDSEGNIVYSGDEPQVAFQDEANVEYYTRYFYPSDIQQLKDKYNTDGSEPLKVYVVYGMIIENTETYSVDELYVENYLKIESLTNTFDSTRYTLDSTTTDMNDIEKYVSGDFAKWTKTGEDEDEGTATATYTIDSDDELNDIESEESVTKYIQFKVNTSAVIDILNGETIENKPTSVQTIGRHYYTRNDYSWENGIYEEKVTHITGTKEKTDDAPYLKFILGADRELSGYVFEDTDEYTTENESAITDDSVDVDEILGNGIYDSGENKVAYVKVELLDASTDQVAQLCSYTTDTDGNKTYSFTEASCVITGTDGAFTFTGLALGDYYLRFTYYDENNKEVDSTTNTSLKTTIITSDGEKTFSLNDYKSTIVTSDPVIAAINKEYGNEYDEDTYTEYWYKYFDDANNTYYSVAVDDLNQREAYNDGLVYTYNDDDKDGVIDSDGVESHSYTTDENGDIILDSDGKYAEEITKMEAYSPEFSITIENNTETSSSATDTNGENTTHLYEYTGFNFGIIEQAEQTVEVEKVITNVSMVNSPTTIFNGNPEDDLDGVSDLDGSTNGSSTYTRIEVEENEMYGADFTVTYEITITNTSDLNYYETDSAYHGYYYMFGLKNLDEDDGYSAEVEISIDSVLDAYDDDLTWLISSTGETTYKYTITSEYIDSDGNEVEETKGTTVSYIINEESATWVDANDSTNTVNVDSTTLDLMENKANTRSNKGYNYDELLYMESWGNISREESLSISIVFTKTMSASDDDTSYENVSSVNELSIAANSGESISSDKDSTKYVRKPQLPDPADSYITISPPTGESESIIPYVVIGVIGLIILSAGIVIIKKKIL